MRAISGAVLKLAVCTADIKRAIALLRRPFHEHVFPSAHEWDCSSVEPSDHFITVVLDDSSHLLELCHVQKQLDSDIYRFGDELIVLRAKYDHSKLECTMTSVPHVANFVGATCVV